MRIRALAVRIMQQFVRDKRSLALIFLAPLLVLTLMYFVFNGQAAEPDVGVTGLPPSIVAKLESAGANVTVYDNREAGMEGLRDGELDAVLEMAGGSPSILLEGSDPAVNQGVQMIVQRAMGQTGGGGVQPDITYLHGKANLTSFDSFGPVLVGFFSFFFVFLLAGVSFLRERTTGTLERLLATPVRRGEVVAGYLSGFGLFTLLQAALIAGYAIYVLGLYMDGSIWLVLLINLLLSLTALTLGTLLSSFASTEFQIIQFIPIVIVPQVFFSGLFSLETMNPWLQKLSFFMPLYYGADALRGTMIRGEGLSDNTVNVLVLLGFSIVFALLNVAALKKQRSI
ncbi:ABC transporter permease [Paenibacillus methanolicus]|uniref:ABC-2 type transport system permease protein n=1 Tax=Paenibacillus methanolicus TaxID=582686 RepID=A0A5S5CJA4_9BACL|nr:ABC transporter permease [Paenibacillus methanolicus]TYP79604.1 ABC-2 type transport system permease protein [Paenibacillus methanolicus]